MQMQVNLQADMPQQNTTEVDGGKDDIDQALTNLQASLEGSTIDSGHVSSKKGNFSVAMKRFFMEN